MEFRMFLLLLSGFVIITVLKEVKGKNENVFKEMYIAQIRALHIKSKSTLKELLEERKTTILFVNAQAHLELTNLEKHITEALEEICADDCTKCEPLIEREHIKSIVNEARFAVDICIQENSNQMQSAIIQTWQYYNDINVIHNSLLDRWTGDQAEETFSEDNVVEILGEVDADQLKCLENLRMVDFLFKTFLKCTENAINSATKDGVNVLAAINKKCNS